MLLNDVKVSHNKKEPCADKKWTFFKQMIQFTIFFCLAITANILRPQVPEEECEQENDGNFPELLGNETAPGFSLGFVFSQYHKDISFGLDTQFFRL